MSEQNGKAVNGEDARFLAFADTLMEKVGERLSDIQLDFKRHFGEDPTFDYQVPSQKIPVPRPVIQVKPDVHVNAADLAPLASMIAEVFASVVSVTSGHAQQVTAAIKELPKPEPVDMKPYVDAMEKQTAAIAENSALLKLVLETMAKQKPVKVDAPDMTPLAESLVKPLTEMIDKLMTEHDRERIQEIDMGDGKPPITIKTK